MATPICPTEGPEVLHYVLHRLIREEKVLSRREAARVFGMGRARIARILDGIPPKPRGTVLPPARPRIPAEHIARIRALDEKHPHLGHRTIASRLALGADGHDPTPPYAHTTIARYRTPKVEAKPVKATFRAKHPNEIWAMDDSHVYRKALTPEEKRSIAEEGLLGLPVDVLEGIAVAHLEKGESLLQCAARVLPRRRKPKRSSGLIAKDRSRRRGRQVFLIGVIDDYARVGWSAELSYRNDARSMARALIEAVRRAGCAPKKLKIDNAKAFKSKLFRAICKALRIKIEFGAPYFPDCQAKVERWWKSWKSQLLLDVSDRGLHRLSLEAAQEVVEEQLFHYNALRGHQTLSLNPSCPTVTPFACYADARASGLTTVGKPLPEDLDLEDLVPLGHARRRVNRFGSLRHGGRLYSVGACHGEPVEVERVIDAVGMPRLHIWKGTKLVANPSLFAPKATPRKRGRPKKLDLGKITWRPPWPECFSQAA